MATTIAYPSDPVTQGATIIQSSTFNAVAADYADLTWAKAQSIMKQKGQKIRHFPTGAEDPSWTFYTRIDLAGDDATMRNIIGIQINVEMTRLTAFSESVANLQVPIKTIYVKVVNWAPSSITLDSGVVVTFWSPSTHEMGIPVDPHAGGLLTGAGLHRLADEAMAFLLKRNAATVPTFEPVVNALSGVNPLA